jgi:hypothetical protein
LKLKANKNFIKMIINTIRCIVGEALFFTPLPVSLAIHANKNSRIIYRGPLNHIQTDKEAVVEFGRHTVIRYKETWMGYYVRPTDYVFKAQFEHFFGLNNGFTADRTVFVYKY